MKKVLTAMAAILAVAIVVIAAAPATNEAATGDFTNPTYIIGSEATPCDIGNGVSTEIKFNRTSFAAEPSFKMYVGTQAEAAGTPIVLGTPISVGGFEFTISKVNDEGTYTVSVAKDGTPTGSKFKIGVSITENWNGLNTTQKYFWGINIKADFVAAEITLEENGTALTTGGTAADPYLIAFDQKVDITIKTTAGTFSYYATGLPAGLSVTTTGHIAGKLSKDIADGATGSFTVSAVDGNTLLTKQVFYKVGTKPADSELTFKILGQSITSYALVNSGQDVIVTDIKIGGVPIDKDKLTVSFSPEGGQNKKWQDGTLVIDTGSGLGSFTVYLTYDAPGSKTVTKSFQVFVVGGIYDANIDPVVHGNP